MPDYLHRTTLRQLQSIAPADLPEVVSNYIEYPDLSAVAGQPKQYWVVTGDVISLMDQAARDAVDLAESETEKDSLSTNLDRVLRAVVLSINDGSFIPGNNYTNQQLKTIIRGKL